MGDESLREIFEHIISIYPESPMKVTNDIRHVAPGAILRLAHLSSSFQVQGSTGQGNFAQVPWVAVFDREITTSAQRGYYIVYLFNSAGRGLYLSLNQGWTDYKDTYGGRKGRILIKTQPCTAEKLCVLRWWTSRRM